MDKFPDVNRLVRCTRMMQMIPLTSKDVQEILYCAIEPVSYLLDWRFISTQSKCICPTLAVDTVQKLKPISLPALSNMEASVSPHISQGHPKPKLLFTTSFLRDRSQNKRKSYTIIAISMPQRLHHGTGF